MTNNFIEDRSNNPVIEAFYRPPKDKEIFCYLVPCKESKTPFKFRYLRTTGGVKIYEPIDRNFLSSSPIPETDLKIKK